MSYEQSLEAAGAEILAFDTFGSYQGDWLAKVIYNGQTLYIQGSYGSCSGCDAFEAEFDYNYGEYCDKHRYNRQESCDDCLSAKDEYNEKLAAFGREYLENPSEKSQLIADFTKQAEWDRDAQDILKWLADN